MDMRIINSGDMLVKRRLIEGNELKSKRYSKRVLAHFFNHLRMISLHAIYI
jgi:hypothetical protein